MSFSPNSHKADCSLGRCSAHTVVVMRVCSCDPEAQRRECSYVLGGCSCGSLARFERYSYELGAHRFGSKEHSGVCNCPPCCRRSTKVAGWEQLHFAAVVSSQACLGLAGAAMLPDAGWLTAMT